MCGRWFCLFIYWFYMSFHSARYKPSYRASSHRQPPFNKSSTHHHLINAANQPAIDINKSLSPNNKCYIWLRRCFLNWSIMLFYCESLDDFLSAFLLRHFYLNTCDIMSEGPSEPLCVLCGDNKNKTLSLLAVTVWCTLEVIPERSVSCIVIPMNSLLIVNVYIF